MQDNQWDLYEVFIRSKQGLDHKHVGSVRAIDKDSAIEAARDLYTRRSEGVSIWLVRSDQIIASNPSESGPLFDPADNKPYRHANYYQIDPQIKHM